RRLDRHWFIGREVRGLCRLAVALELCPAGNKHPQRLTFLDFDGDVLLVGHLEFSAEGGHGRGIPALDCGRLLLPRHPLSRRGLKKEKRYQKHTIGRHANSFVRMLARRASSLISTSAALISTNAAAFHFVRLPEMGLKLPRSGVDISSMECPKCRSTL